MNSNDSLTREKPWLLGPCGKAIGKTYEIQAGPCCKRYRPVGLVVAFPNEIAESPAKPWGLGPVVWRGLGPGGLGPGGLGPGVWGPGAWVDDVLTMRGAWYVDGLGMHVSMLAFSQDDI